MRVLSVGLWVRIVAVGEVLLVVGALTSVPATARERAVGRTVSSTVTAGQWVAFSGSVSNSPRGSTVVLDRAVGRWWVPVAVTRTASASGAFSFGTTTSGVGRQTFRARVPGTRVLSPAVSDPLTLTVNRAVSVRLRVTPAALALGDSATFTGSVGPFVASALVQLEQQSANGWATIATTTLSAKGGFSFTFAPTAMGTGTYRVVVPASAGRYLAEGTSPSRTVVVVAPPTWASVSAGTSYTCATKSDATLWCWGLNSSGQLGVGDTVDRSSPTKVVGTGWTSVATGAAHACATKSDGTLWCWGANESGELGLGTLVDASTPAQVG